jgi:type I restriction enzyme, S subunit
LTSQWETARLDECAEIVSGATPSTSLKAYWNGDIYWATPKDLSELDGAYISDTSRKLTRAGLQNCAATILPAGSVLFSSRAPIGLVAVNTVPMATNQGFKSFIPKPDRTDPKFLYWWLRANRSFLESLGNGATFKEVSKAIISRVEIVLPPLAKQRRIAEVLDRADALGAQRRAALVQLDTLTQSIFFDLFGDPSTNSKRWELRRLGDEISVQGGYAFKSSDYTTAGIRLVKISNVHKDDLEWSDVDYLPTHYLREFSAFSLCAGDIVLALTRPIVKSLSSVKVAVVQSSDLPCLLNQRVGRFSFPKDSGLIAAYLFEYCRTKAFFNVVRRFCSESLQPNMSSSQIEGIRIAVPPIELQNEFARRVQAVQTLRNKQRACLSEIDALFASLQHRAFRGEL